MAISETPLTPQAGSPFSDLTVSLVPKSGKAKDFNFDLHLSKEDFGASSNKLMFRGAGQINGEKFKFDSLISQFKLQYTLSTVNYKLDFQE